MSTPTLTGLLALIAASTFVGVSVALVRTRWSLASAVLGAGLFCFAVMAMTHVFEAFAIFPGLGWGQPHSIGHFIDLGAAFFGVTLVAASLLLRGYRQTKTPP